MDEPYRGWVIFFLIIGVSVGGGILIWRMQVRGWIDWQKAMLMAALATATLGGIIGLLYRGPFWLILLMMLGGAIVSALIIFAWSKTGIKW